MKNKTQSNFISELNSFAKKQTKIRDGKLATKLIPGKSQVSDSVNMKDNSREMKKTFDVNKKTKASSSATMVQELKDNLAKYYKKD